MTIRLGQRCASGLPRALAPTKLLSLRPFQTHGSLRQDRSPDTTLPTCASLTPWSVFQDGAQSNDSSPVTSAQNLDTTTKDLNVACRAAPYTAERIKRRENGTQATQRQATLPPARTPTKGDCTYQQWTNGHPTHLKDYGDHGDGLYVTLGTREQPQGLPPQRRQPDSRVFPTDGPTSTGNAPAAATPPDEPR